MTEADILAPIYGAIKFDGVEETRAAKFSVAVKHDILSSKRAHRKMKIKIYNGTDVTGSVSRDSVDATWLAALLTDTLLTGTAGTIKSGIALDTDALVSVTDTADKNARGKLVVATAPITTAGKATVNGYGVDDNPKSEAVAIGLLSAGAEIPLMGVFKSFTSVAIEGIRSTGGGTLTLESIAGDTTATLGVAQRKFSLVGSYEIDANHFLMVTCNNCKFDSGNFGIGDQQAQDNLTWYMTGESDDDLIVQSLNT